MLTFKIISIATILLSAYLGTVFSAKIASKKARDRIFSLGNAFAGGIFLGTGMLHVLPDAHSGIALIKGSHDVPLVAFFASCGFLLVLFIQRVLIYEERIVARLAKKGTDIKFSPNVLMVSLSVHSLIAGVALGTEDILKKALVLLIAIIVYKVSAVFTLEVNLHRSGLHNKPSFRKAGAIFSFMTPIGIMIGLGLTEILSRRAGQFVTIAFDSLTAGSFLYIALSDILEKEFMRPKDRFFKFALFLIKPQIIKKTIIISWR